MTETCVILVSSVWVNGPLLHTARRSLERRVLGWQNKDMPFTVGFVGQKHFILLANCSVLTLFEDTY